MGIMWSKGIRKIKSERRSQTRSGIMRLVGKGGGGEKEGRKRDVAGDNKGSRRERK